MIVAFEVGSQAQFNAKYRGPTWPGGASGVTFGIGFDLGYSTAAEIASTWSPYLPAAMVQAMCGVAGLKGAAAQEACFRLRGAVTVSWTAAMAVFENHDMPKWEALVEKSLPNTDSLSPDSFGALVSLAYNRGASFNLAGDRYMEMREIHTNMAAKSFAAIPGNIRSMERLWPNVRGLILRRQQEADLFQRGLSEITVEPTPPPVAASPSPLPARSTPRPLASAPVPAHHTYDVRWIQASLNALGAEPQLGVDGDFGPATLAAVKRFQMIHGLAVDGIAGPQTISAIAGLVA